jgi:membrane-associated protease RseP (regulator of RpoE activity)
MKHRAGLFLTAAVATIACGGVAWPHSPTTEPSAAWIDYSPPDVTDAAHFAMDQRLAEVAYRIGVSNADLCAGARTRLLGLISTFSDPPLDAGVDQASGPLTISWVVPGAPAAGSGLRAGDRIFEIDGESLRSEPEAWDRRLQGNDVVTLGIERAGARSRVAVSPAPACDYDVELSASEDVNAFAEQRHVVITEGMLALLPRNDQLAVVVGHELGHIAAGHTEGGVGSGMPADAESEADYLGIYFAARAGYDISGAEDVLRRIVAARRGGWIDTEYMPDVARRIQAIDAATDEIDAKRTAGENLYPSADRLFSRSWN